MKWYKRDPAAALEGMLGLTIEERGAYNALIDLIYARAPRGSVTDQLVCKALGCRPQTWQRLKTALMAKGKVWENPPGNLLCNRVVSEVVSAEFRRQNMERLGQVSALKRSDLNKLRDGVWPNRYPTATLETPTPRYKSSTNSDSEIPTGKPGEEKKKPPEKRVSDYGRAELERMYAAKHNKPK